MVQLNEVVPFEEGLTLDISQALSSSTSDTEIPSTFSSSVSFGLHRKGSRWKELVSSLLSIRSIYITMAVLLVSITASSLAALSVVSQKQLAETGLRDRAASNAFLTSAAVAVKMTIGFNLVKAHTFTSFGFDPLQLNGSYPVPLPLNYQFWINNAQSSVAQVGSNNYFACVFPDGKMILSSWATDGTISLAVSYPASNPNTVTMSYWKTGGLPLPKANLFFGSSSFVLNDTWVINQHFNSLIGKNPPCNTTFQYSDLVQTPARLKRVVNSFAVAYAVCDSNNKTIAGLISSITTNTISAILNTTDGSSMSLIINQDRMLVATSNGDSPFANATSTSPRVYAPNSTIHWIAQVSAAVPVSQNYSAFISIDGNNYLMLAMPAIGIPFTKWTLVKIYPMAPTEEIQRRYMITVIGITIAIVIASIIVVMLVAYWMTKPLKHLSQELRHVARMELDLRQLSTPRFYEAKLLQSSFMQLHTAIKSFRKFVPNQVILNILKYNREAVSHLSPAKVTIMFHDIQGFTSLAETMKPMQLAALTEEYLEAMTFIISQYGGTVDKYIGDCIMSIFNKPERLPDHPTVACRTAVACMRELQHLNKRWKSQYGVQISSRIGIHTGEALVGNMGSDVRMNYTVIGDNVNIAARLESINKVYGTDIIISEAVNKCIPEELMSRRLATVRVPGKTTQMDIYQLSFRDDGLREFYSLYEQSLHSLEMYDMKNAKKRILEALDLRPNDTASMRLLQRIVDSPEEQRNDWTFVETLTKG
ncbi:adenylate/guanylate cyclase with integral membrane sensor [Planoprotostelium fungivorum]|uniref:Adenylate/guanylate cyclase with integral membrane sensor n=1 Tax=Planoprotostelium fungivorum TaxID=1890364 RepID=A0A2P6N9N6_9EUKA|nr:adenylate/guanylate cyclase with integral membrane sensor [Planoprotostelium fungivorum]